MFQVSLFEFKSKIFIIAIIIYIMVEDSNEITDYCDLKDDRCQFHLGCEAEVIFSIYYLFKFQTLLINIIESNSHQFKQKTSGRINIKPAWPSYIDKIYFTNQLNRFRSNISNTAYNIFDVTAANMKAINWDEELQYFTVNSLNKFDIDAPINCGNTKRYKSVSFVSSYSYKSSLENIYDNYLENIKTTIIQRKRRAERFSMVIDAETESVGCAIIEYKITELGNVMPVVEMQCLFSRAGGLKFDEIYMPGGRCDLCECIETCSQYYDGLCAYRNLEAQPIYCKSVGEKLSNANNVSSVCIDDAKVDTLYVHFSVIYTLVFIGFVSHLSFFLYYKGFEL